MSGTDGSAGFWSFADCRDFTETIDEYFAINREFLGLRPAMEITITPGNDIFAMPIQLPTISMRTDGDFDADDPKLYVHIVHGADKDEVVSGLRSIADLVEKHWDRMTGDFQCYFEVVGGVIRVPPPGFTLRERDMT